MEDTKFSRRMLCQYFWDHNHSRSLSVTYPVSPIVHLGYTYLNLHKKECLEAYLDYPCFQIYVASPEPFLEHPEGRKQAISLISRILLNLERDSFFSVAGGVRLELYNGQSDFERAPSSGKLTQWCLKAIGEHSVNERECRNELAYLRATVRQRLLSHRKRYPVMKEGQDTGRDQLGWILFEGQLARERILESERFTSSETIHCHPGPNGNHKEARKFYEKGRRKSISDLDAAHGRSTLENPRSHHFGSLPVPGPSVHTATGQRPRWRSNSTGGDMAPLSFSAEQKKRFGSCQSALLRHLYQHEADVDSKPYLSKRVEKVIAAAMSKFHAPFVPNSFWSPPYQPWHSLVIVVRNLVEVGKELFALWFNKEYTSEGSLEPESAIPGEFRYEVQHISINPDQNDQQSPSLSDLLKHSLRLLGLSNPSMDCPVTATDVPSYWFLRQNSGQQVLELDDDGSLRETYDRPSLTSEGHEKDSMSSILGLPEMEHILKTNRIVKHTVNPIVVAPIEDVDMIG